MKSVVAVTLDAEGTLLHPHPPVGVVYAEVIRRYGINADTISLERSFRDSFRSVSADRRDQVSDQAELEFWKRVVLQTLEGFDYGDKFDSIFEDLYREFGTARRWKLVQDGVPTIKGLRERGYLVSVLSNWDSRLRQVLQEIGLEPLLDACFISCEIGFEKPDRRIFQYVEKALSLEPQQFLHVGNSLEHDAEGAKNAGWEYLIVQTGEALSPGHEHRVSNLGEVLLRLPNRRAGLRP